MTDTATRPHRVVIIGAGFAGLAAARALKKSPVDVAHVLPLVVFRNRLVVAIDWCWSYLTHAHGVRLITSTGRQDDDI